MGEINAVCSEVQKQDTQYMYKRKIEPFSATMFAAEKQLIITYSECVFVVLVIQHGKRM